MIIDCKCPKCGGDLVVSLRAFNAPPEGVNPFALVSAIIEEEAAAAGLTAEQLRGPDRRRHVYQARKKAIIRASVEVGMSSVRIGRMFNRDHSTILQALRG